jgi:hypothetical protein
MAFVGADTPIIVLGGAKAGRDSFLKRHPGDSSNQIISFHASSL